MVMENMEQGSLMDFLTEQERFPLEEALVKRIVRQESNELIVTRNIPNYYSVLMKKADPEVQEDQDPEPGDELEALHEEEKEDRQQPEPQ